MPFVDQPCAWAGLDCLRSQHINWQCGCFSKAAVRFKRAKGWKGAHLSRSAIFVLDNLFGLLTDSSRPRLCENSEYCGNSVVSGLQSSLMERFLEDILFSEFSEKIIVVSLLSFIRSRSNINHQYSERKKPYKPLWPPLTQSLPIGL